MSFLNIKPSSFYFGGFLANKYICVHLWSVSGTQSGLVHNKRTELSWNAEHSIMSTKPYCNIEFISIYREALIQIVVYPIQITLILLSQTSTKAQHPDWTKKMLHLEPFDQSTSIFPLLIKSMVQVAAITPAEEHVQWDSMGWTSTKQMPLNVYFFSF